MIQKTPNTFRNLSKVNDRNGRATRSRVDASHLLLPSPNFNVTSGDQLLEFLDLADSTFRDVESREIEVATRLRELYGVTHVSRFNTPESWATSVMVCRNHALLKTLHEDPFVRRAFEKPRGYPGDAVLLDYIYDREMSRPAQDLSPIGSRIQKWTTQSSACNGVKARRAFIAEFIDRLAANKNDVEILSVACGHFREADISSAILRRKLKRIVAIDSDEESLNVVDRDYEKYAVQTIPIRARQMVTGRMDFGSFDFIYSAGLFDYLSDINCRQLSTRWFSMLKPGGYMLLTNFFEGIEGVGFMEAFMDWNLVYRNRVQMMAMTEGIDESEIANIHYFAEENRNVICILVEKVA